MRRQVSEDNVYWRTRKKPALKKSSKETYCEIRGGIDERKTPPGKEGGNSIKSSGKIKEKEEQNNQPGEEIHPIGA